MSDTPKLLRLPDVMAQTGLSRSMVYRLMDAGDFPRPVSVAGTRVRAWPADAVAAFITAQIEAA